MTKIIVPIDLGEYHQSYAGRYVFVWVNPPREKMLERENLISAYGKVLASIVAHEATDFKSEIDVINEAMYAWRAEIWSQHNDPDSHWTVSDIHSLHEGDPAFYEWIQSRTDDLFPKNGDISAY